MLGTALIAGLAVTLYRLTAVPPRLTVLCARHPPLCRPAVPGTRLASTTTVGRWRRPPAVSVDVHSERTAHTGLGRQWFGLKQWSFLSFAAEDILISGAVLDMGYVSGYFLYVVDLQADGAPMYEFESLVPGRFVTEFAPSSIAGCSKFGSAMQMCAVPGGWRWTSMQPLYEKNGKAVLGGLDVHVGANKESLVFVFPTNDESDDNSTAYVHKSAGNPSTLHNLTLHKMAGSGSSADLAFAARHGGGGLDWTHSFARRETKWRWCSLSARLNDSTLVGINFSEEVYAAANPPNPTRQIEDAVWINGILYPLLGESALVWTQGENTWTIKSAAPTAAEDINLTVEILGQREDHKNAAVFVSDFVQPYGYFSGSVHVTDALSGNTASFTLSGQVGVVEDHHAIW